MGHATPWRKFRVGFAVGVLGIGLSGCSTTVPASCDGTRAGERAAFGEFAGLPRARMGCLPFPGLMTLYATAGAEGLGEHGYSADRGEASRGIVYTTRGGFLDVAHIRNSIDTTAYIHARVSHALREGWGCVRFRLHEPSVYEVTLTEPDSWAGMSPAERARVVDEAALRLSQRLALEAMTWHEILTWYGYKSTGLISEAGSAFTYEDGPSHAVGVLIAGEALRRGGDFNAEVTLLLDQTLEELGMVGPEELAEAVRAVDGDWWSGGKARRRHLETGLERGGITPWVVEGVAFADPAGPVTWDIPTMDDVFGHDCGVLESVAIRPKVFEEGKIMRRLGDGAERVRPRRDFPVLIADIRESIGAEFARVEPVDRTTETADRGR